jgi:uncharacterized protein YkwD
MAGTLCRSVALLVLVGLLGCKAEKKAEPPIQSTLLEKKTTKPAGQPTINTMVEPPSKTDLAKGKLIAPGLTLSTDEEQFLNLVQQARDTAKAPRLKPNPVLFELARAHAAKLVREKELNSFVEPKGYPHMSFGANVGVSGKIDFASAMAGGADNLNNPKYSEVGLAVAHDSAGGRYIHVQVFGQPQK